MNLPTRRIATLASVILVSASLVTVPGPSREVADRMTGGEARNLYRAHGTVITGHGPATTATTTAPPASTHSTTVTTVTTATSTTTVPEAPTTTSPVSTTDQAPPPSPGGLNGAQLHVDPSSPARVQAETWRHDRPHEASLLDLIAAQPTARWFGDWNPDIRAEAAGTTEAANEAGAVPVYVVYNIPQRDCSGHSGGGAGSAEGYRSWVRALADGIGDRTAVIVLEPDALALLDCLSEEGQAERLDLIRSATETLAANGRTQVYIDAGHARWHGPEEMARRLQAGGVDQARGFALNVSNFVGTEETVAYGEAVSALLGGKPFVVDTSRNGLGPAPDSQWCNPPGRAVGRTPTTQTGHPLVDAYLWIKVPGESDGTCNGGPAAGVFWPEYALGLVERAAG